jgi:undecaprenyl-diphosphatase
VQGLTEFLPVSSSGHLVLFGAWLGVEQEGILFEVALHAATLLAVVVFYRARVASLVAGALRGDADAWRYGLKLGVATLPAVAAVLLARGFFEGLYERVAPVGLALWVTGAAVYSTRFTLPRARGPEPGWADALWIGAAQAAAIVPGISRSGATVATGLALGVAPAAAAEFSFMMSLPAILGAVVLQVPDLGHVAPGAWTGIAAGAVVALGSGVAALWLFVRLLRSRAFHHFAWYVWPLGAVVLLWAQLR